MKFRLTLATLLTGVLLTAPVMAAPIDRAALVGQLCGNATAMGEASTTLTALAATGPEDERQWAAPLARGLIDRSLICDSSGAVLKTEAGTLDAVTREPRAPSEGGRSPVLSLKNRATFELADAALTLRNSDSLQLRANALRTLERRAATCPRACWKPPPRPRPTPICKPRSTISPRPRCSAPAIPPSA